MLALIYRVSAVLIPVSVAVKELLYWHLTSPEIALEARKAVIGVVVDSSFISGHYVLDRGHQILVPHYHRSVAVHTPPILASPHLNDSLSLEF